MTPFALCWKKLDCFLIIFISKLTKKNVETMKNSNKTSKQRSKDTTLKIIKNNGFDAALLNLGIKFIPNPSEK